MWKKVMKRTYAMEVGAILAINDTKDGDWVYVGGLLCYECGFGGGGMCYNLPSLRPVPKNGASHALRRGERINVCSNNVLNHSTKVYAAGCT